MFEPVIKWSGSKRSQAKEIISYFPKEIKTYYEPFCGGCSVLRRLINEETIDIQKYICSDVNADLINLWLEIKQNPENVVRHYAALWKELNKDEDKDRKRKYFEYIRTRYNNEHNPLDFMFIMRTTTNGMPRYNKQGNFNNSFHITRNGIQPLTLEKIINEWSELLNRFNVIFQVQDFREVKPSKEDFLYLDPPYHNTKGMYFGTLDSKDLFKWMGNLSCGYILSYDGISGEVDNTCEVPIHLYNSHLYIKSGNSSFKRTIGKSNNSVVFESLYIK